MKKLIVVLAIIMIGISAPVKQAHSQIPIIDIIKAGVKKVIKAMDLQIQRQQNKVIWMQNAQKTLENSMSKLKLDEISGWVDKQKNLYKDYYDELAKVKSMISLYRRVREITQKQIDMVGQYKRAWNLFKNDKHFTAAEVDYMAKVYTGIIDESIKNLEQIALVINSFSTTMSDAKRLELINTASDKLDENYFDMTRFNNQNTMVIIQRAKSQSEIDMVRKLYGIQ